VSLPAPILNGIACAAVHAQHVLGQDATVCCVALDKSDKPTDMNALDASDASTLLEGSKNGSGTKRILQRLTNMRCLEGLGSSG